MKQLLTLVCLSLFFIPAQLSAQGENNQWCFGAGTKVNFNTNPPTISQINMATLESSASVCDAAGNLLFYSSGAYVWDRNGNLMPNGQALSGNGPATSPIWSTNMGSSARGVAIAKSPSNANRYYLIVTDAVEDLSFRAYYSVIDMSLNGGMGDVVPAQKSIVMADSVTEGITVVEAANCMGNWVILHSLLRDEFFAYRIDNNGLDPVPVISQGLFPAYASFVPYLAMSGREIFNNAGTIMVHGAYPGEIASFDKATGQFSGFSMFPQLVALAFSPDDSRLYTSNNSMLLQHNMALWPNVPAIISSQIAIDTGNVLAMRQGPDDKLFVLRVLSTRLGIINNPNAAGTACQYVQNVIQLPVYPTLYNELGSNAPLSHADTSFDSHVTDTTLCFAGTATLVADSGQLYLWNTGEHNRSIEVQQDGAFWVTLQQHCTIVTDTYNVQFVNFDVELGPDTFLCPGGSVQLNAEVPGAVYRWQDNSTAASYTASAAGLYKVQVTVDGCTKTDSVPITAVTPSLQIVENDTTICKDRPLTLHAIAVPESSLSWNTGSTAATTPVDSSGTYTVQATNVCGVYTDAVDIDVVDCNCDAFVPNGFTPNGDGNNDVFKVTLVCPGVASFSLRIFNRYGQTVFKSSDPGQGWDGAYKGSKADLGAYFYYLRYKNDLGSLVEKKGDIILLR